MPGILTAMSVRIQASGGGGPSPQGWWKFNEGSGTNAADSSGNGNAGTLTGGVTWGTGPNSNACVVFDGTDDYVDIANESFFDYDRTQAFSITFWVKPSSSATGVDSIVSKMQTFGNQPGIDVQYDADNARVKFYLINGSGAAINVNTSSSMLPANTWAFVAVTYAGGSDQTGMKIYINNGAATAGGAGTLTGSILNDNPVWWGRGGAGAYQGELDDGRIYNVELNSTQVGDIYTAGAQ